MERRDLFADDLTEEKTPTPGEREDAAYDTALDPQDDDDEPAEEG